jgi:hypothetical protein
MRAGVWARRTIVAAFLDTQAVGIAVHRFILARDRRRSGCCDGSNSRLRGGLHQVTCLSAVVSSKATANMAPGFASG